MRITRRCLWTAMLTLAAMLNGALSSCDQRPTDDRQGAVAPAQQPPSPWRVGEGRAAPGIEAAIAIDAADAEADSELQDAIAEARATADEARERWAATAQSLRTRWAVKWAAEVEADHNDAASNEGSDARVEYIWVQPVHWSPFRIEGILANEPFNTLAAARDGQPLSLGDLVSFPIEELVDWVHYPDARFTPDAPREGGFTIGILEARYGKPRSPRTGARPDLP